MNRLHFERPGGDADLKRAGRAAEAQAQTQTDTTAPAKPTTAQADGVTVSGRAARIAEAAARARQLPEVRQERVVRLRAEIEADTYRPHASDIADAIIKRGKL